jgi:hypothetical protein
MGVISEATGLPGHYVYNQINGVKPHRSSHFAQKIPVGWVSDYRKYIFALQLTRIRNDLDGWNCQNYVMEGLQGLYEDGCIEREDFRNARRTLRTLMASHTVRYSSPESE